MNEYKYLTIILLAFMLIFDDPFAYAEKRTALVIGNSAYKSSPLKNPANDAADMSALLKKCGFEVIKEIDATRRTMIRVVDKFYGKLRKSDVGLFYFAGHGVQVDGHNYLIPVDAHVTSESDISLESIDARRILGKMKNAGNRLNVVILDACRDNPFKRSFRTSRRGLAVVDAPRGAIIAYATSPGSVAADGDGKNGLYTSKLIQHMQTSGIKIEEVFKRTRNDVIAESKDFGIVQTPWESSSLTGDFYFFPKSFGKTETEKTTATTNKEKMAAGTENLFWQSIMNSEKKEMFEAYLQQYPNGMFAPIAKLKIEKFSTSQSIDGNEEQEVFLKDERIPDSGISTPVPPAVKTEKTSTQNGTLYVTPTPSDARVRIMNIRPVYRPGIELAPGRYHIEVSKSGYRTVNQWEEISLGQNLKVPIELQKTSSSSLSPQASSDFSYNRTSQHQVGKVWREPRTGMQFVRVAKGCFKKKNYFKTVDECLKGFWISKYEVTQGQWKRMVGNNPSHFKKGDDYPVEQVSWHDTQRFIKKLNRKTGRKFRLPSSDEWEYAARSGGKDEKYAGGNNINSVAWYKGNSGRTTHLVGTKSPNGFGIHDMSGNVSEWCQDWYGVPAAINSEDIADLYRPKVIRGGSWQSAASRCRSTFVNNDSEISKKYFIGFRLVLPSVK